MLIYSEESLELNFFCFNFIPELIIEFFEFKFLNFQIFIKALNINFNSNLKLFSQNNTFIR